MTKSPSSFLLPLPSPLKTPPLGVGELGKQARKVLAWPVGTQVAESPGTHTPAMFIHSSCSWKGPEWRPGTLGASKATPYSRMSFSGSLPKRDPGHWTGDSLAPALNGWRPCLGVEWVSRSLPHQVAFHRFCKSDSATTAPPHLLLPQFPHPSKQRPLHTPSCQRQKSPPRRFIYAPLLSRQGTQRMFFCQNAPPPASPPVHHPFRWGASQQPPPGFPPIPPAHSRGSS